MDTTFLNDKNFCVLCTQPFTPFSKFYTKLAILRGKQEETSEVIDTYLDDCINYCRDEFGIDLFGLLPHPNFWKKSNEKLEGSKRTWSFTIKNIWGDDFTFYLGKFVNKRNRDHITFVPYIRDNSLPEGIEIATPDFSFTNKTDAWKYMLIHIAFYLDSQCIIDKTDSDTIVICPKEHLGDRGSLVEVTDKPKTLVYLNDDFMRIWTEGMPSKKK